MIEKMPEPRSAGPVGDDPTGNAWLSSWRRSVPTKDPAPFPGAKVRVFVRRDASRGAVEAMRTLLGTAAKGRWQVVPFAAWTAIDLELSEDMDLVKSDHGHSIDGWQELGGA